MTYSSGKSVAGDALRDNEARRYTGANITRQDKFLAREQRRWGDWTYWEIPAPVLWLEEPYVLSPFDDILFVEPVFVDIWA